MKCRVLVKYVPLYICLALFAAVLATSPERYVPACLEGIALWAQCVLPALFPFMVITLLFISTGGAELAARPFKRVCNFFGLPPVAAVIFIMSAFSGYPAGSRIVYEYCQRGEISEADAQKLAPLCSTSGPLFLIASVGQNMFKSKTAGALLLAAHLVSVAAVALAICLIERGKAGVAAQPLRAERGNVLYDSFYSAVISVIVAGGFICFFYTLARAANDFYILFPLEAALTPLLGQCAPAFCRGLIEATGGCAALAAAGGGLALPLAGFLITFGGLSIIAQQLCYLTKCGVKPLKFMLAKAAQGALCFALLLPLIAA